MKISTMERGAVQANTGNDDIAKGDQPRDPSLLGGGGSRASDIVRHEGGRWGLAKHTQKSERSWLVPRPAEARFQSDTTAPEASGGKRSKRFHTTFYMLTKFKFSNSLSAYCRAFPYNLKPASPFFSWFVPVDFHNIAIVPRTDLVWEGGAQDIWSHICFMSEQRNTNEKGIRPD